MLFLHAIQYLFFVALVSAVIVALVVVGVPCIHDEIAEFRAVSRAERKKRKEEDDAFFTGMLLNQRGRFETRMVKPLWKPKQSR